MRDEDFGIRTRETSVRARGGHGSYRGRIDLQDISEGVGR